MSCYLSVAEHAQGMCFNNFIMLILLNFNKQLRDTETGRLFSNRTCAIWKLKL